MNFHSLITIHNYFISAYPHRVARDNVGGLEFTVVQKLSKLNFYTRHSTFSNLFTKVYSKVVKIICIFYDSFTNV